MIIVRYLAISSVIQLTKIHSDGGGVCISQRCSDPPRYTLQGQTTNTPAGISTSVTDARPTPTYDDPRTYNVVLHYPDRVRYPEGSCEWTGGEDDRRIEDIGHWAESVCALPH